MGPISAGAIFTALLGIIKAIPIVDKWFTQLVSLYISEQKLETKKEIMDAAALSARANTTEERHAALNAWNIALSRRRLS